MLNVDFSIFVDYYTDREEQFLELQYEDLMILRIFATMWFIWVNRNMAVHEFKCQNSVILSHKHGLMLPNSHGHKFIDLRLHGLHHCLVL